MTASDDPVDALETGRYLAVLDRFEPLANGTELAVFVVETEGEPLAQLELPRMVVPRNGRQVDAVFEVTLSDDHLELAHRPDDSDERRESARSRFDRLARRPPSRAEADEGRSS